MPEVKPPISIRFKSHEIEALTDHYESCYGVGPLAPSWNKMIVHLAMLGLALERKRLGKEKSGVTKKIAG